MLLSTTIHCLLALSWAQAPEAATPPETSVETVQEEPGKPPAPKQEPKREIDLSLIHHAGWFPSTTLAAVSMPAIASHRIGLMRSGMDDVVHWLGSSWRQARVLKPLALGPLDPGTLAESGFSFALTSFAPSGAGWILIAPSEGRALEMRQGLPAAHKQIEKNGGEVAVQLLGVDQAWTVADRFGAKLSYLVTDERIFVADSFESIANAVEQRKDEASSLRASKGYQRFCARCARENRPFLNGFVQPQLGVEAALAFLPGITERHAMRKVLGRLELDRLREVGISMFAKDGRLQDLTWIGLPEPRAGFIGQLLGGAGPLHTDLLRTIAPNALMATLFTIDLGKLFAEARQAVGVLHPSLRGLIEGKLESFETKSGLRIAEDILPLLGTQGSYQEYAASSERVCGLTLQLADAAGAQRVLTSMAQTLGFQRGKIGAIPATSIPDLFGGGTPWMATIQGDVLVLGSSPQFLHRTVSLLEAGVDPKLHQLAEPLAARGELPTAFHWADCAGVGRSFVNALSTWGGHRLVADSLARLVIARGGATRMTVHGEPEGLACRSESPLGNLYLALAGAYWAKLCELEADTPAARATRRLSLMRDILAAQQQFRGRSLRDQNKNGRGEYGRLPDLIRAGLISARWFDDPSAKIFEIENYRYRIYLPRGADNQEQDFLVIAWPAPQSAGIAYAATGRGAIYANKIIGQTGNINLCDPRDVFAKGEFGAEILPAWALLESRRDTTLAGDSSGLRDFTADERQQLDVLAAAEAAGTVTQKVLGLLDSENPILVARTAKVLGILRHRKSVTALCEKVLSHPDVGVQRAAMAALCRIRSKESIATSIAALDSKDSAVRTLAAQNVGYLHASNATGKLLDVLAADPMTDAPDRIAALLALADLGRPACLLPAAARVKSTGSKEQSALVYLFQTLSPKLGADEIDVMIAILDDESELLRRYAIQRLGVLKHPKAEGALRARLKHEPTLRGLIEVSLRVLEQERATSRLKDYVQNAKRRGKELWQSLPAHFAYGVLAGAVLLLLLSITVRRRRARERSAAKIAAMVAPSEGFDEDGQDYDDEEDFAEAEYEDAEYAPARARGHYASRRDVHGTVTYREGDFDPGLDDNYEGDENGYLGDDPFDDYYADEEIITDERDLHR